MANIRVDHSQFGKTASAVETYIAKHRNHMKTIDTSIELLHTTWQGNDYSQLKLQWQQINAPDSTSGNMLKSLQNYADFLRFAANKYKTAQTNAINRANRLPKY